MHQLQTFLALISPGTESPVGPGDPPAPKRDPRYLREEAEPAGGRVSLLGAAAQNPRHSAQCPEATHRGQGCSDLMNNELQLN